MLLTALLSHVFNTCLSNNMAAALQSFETTDSILSPMAAAPILERHVTPDSNRQQAFFSATFPLQDRLQSVGWYTWDASDNVSLLDEGFREGRLFKFSMNSLVGHDPWGFPAYTKCYYQTTQPFQGTRFYSPCFTHVLKWMHNKLRAPSLLTVALVFGLVDSSHRCCPPLPSVLILQWLSLPFARLFASDLSYILQYNTLRLLSVQPLHSFFTHVFTRLPRNSRWCSFRSMYLAAGWHHGNVSDHFFNPK